MCYNSVSKLSGTNMPKAYEMKVGGENHNGGISLITSKSETNFNITKRERCIVSTEVVQ